MSPTGRRSLALLLVLSACAGLTACGGSTESSSYRGEAPRNAPTDTARDSHESGEGEAGPSEDVGETAGERKQRSAGERAAYELKRYGRPSSRSAPFAKYSGKSVQGRAVLHLAEFGEEAGDGDRGQVQLAIVGYLGATAAEEWQEACTYLAAETRAQVELGARAQGAAATCATALPKFIEMFDADDQGATVETDGVASLRLDEGSGGGVAGFALFHGGDGDDRWMAVRQEGGGWKVISVTPQPFG